MEMIENAQEVKTQELEHIDPAASWACACTSDGLSGSVQVPHTGCVKESPNSAAICYVTIPDLCEEMSRPSTTYPGARWRFCEYRDKNTAPSDPNTHLDHVIDDGMHKYVMQHSGVKTTLVTEGNRTLTPEQTRNRTDAVLAELKKKPRN